jgi:1-aminocyclopropane-1-carboxylate deaminase/D-cysteine desulfhydrase-like pyridoxal-dependent ACC family enzyme
MAGLISLLRANKFSRDQNVLFLHTGGTPSLFGYPELVEGK